MVKFECNCCGKCCSSFGEFIKVERQITDHDYFCRYGITNELFRVHVLPEFADEFSEEFEEMEGNGRMPQRKVAFLGAGIPMVRVFSVQSTLPVPPSAGNFSATGC